MSELFSLKGQTAVVTGAARGIGQAMAIGLAEAGADIILILVRTEHMFLVDEATFSTAIGALD